MRLKTSVIVCSVNRGRVLHDTIATIARQTHQPDEILIVSPGREHVLPETLTMPKVRFVLGSLGLPAQRNAGLDQLEDDCDLIAFFDDDIELSAFYLEHMVSLFSEREQVLIASGRLLHDGGRGKAISRESARELTCEYDRRQALGVKVVPSLPSDSGYGCNMVVRYRAARNVRFDSGLPLYAWLEDRDYSQRITKGRYGPVECQNAVAVHLGSRSGRIGGVRMGFSEIINPVYLWTKNRTFTLRYVVVQYWLRCLVGNVLGIIRRDSEYDRLGLLRGNLVGFYHLMGGHCDPSHILQL